MYLFKPLAQNAIFQHVTNIKINEISSFFVLSFEIQ